jgi:hypothetical protein
MHKPDYTDTHAFSGGEHEDPDEWPTADDDENWTRASAERALETLQALHPGHMTSRSLLCTPSGNWMETTAHHGPLITDLLVRLLAMTEPHNDDEREAMQALLVAMKAPAPKVSPVPNPNDPDDAWWDEERQSEAASASRRGPTPYTPPRYDEVFAAGTAALDEVD